MRWACGAVAVLACLTGVGAHAHEEGNAGDVWKGLALDDWPVLYKSKIGPVNKWELLGRFDLQYGSLDSDHGDGDKLEVARLRIGTRVKFLDDWSFQLVANILDDDDDVTYGSLDTAYLGYSPSKQFKFRLGKQTPHFGQEWSTPSGELLVIERALLVEQVRPQKSTGFTMAGDWEQWNYELGVFSGDRDREFGSGDAGLFYLASIGYDFTHVIDGWEDFDWRLDYLHNDGDAANNGVKPYSHSFSTSLNLRKKRLRLATEAIYADGIEGRPEAWGFLVTPSWELIEDKLDLVMRYHYAKSDGRDGLRLRSRYETLAPDLTDRGRGDEYQSMYLGLKYYILKDHLTFTSGLEWSEMLDHYGDGGDLNGVSALGVVRFEF